MMKQCQACKTPMQGPDWMKFCEDCYRGIRSSTKSYRETDYYAGFPEEGAPEPHTPPNPAHVQAQLRHMWTLLAEVGLPEDQGPDTRTEAEKRAACAHEWREAFTDHCIHCGLHRHQVIYSMTVRPRVYDEVTGEISRR